MSKCWLVQTLMPMEGDPTEQAEDEQVGMAWTNWSEHMILKMAAAKVICRTHGHPARVASWPARSCASNALHQC